MVNRARSAMLPLLALCLVAPSRPQAGPPAVDEAGTVLGGWGRARWGMTPDQVLAAVPDAVKVESAVDVSVVLRGVQVSDRPYDISLGFDRRGKLSGASFTSQEYLRAYGGQKGEQVEAARLKWNLVGGKAAFEELADELVRLHGKPFAEPETRGDHEVKRVKLWKTADTVIDLEYYSIYTVPMLFLSYGRLEPPPGGWGRARWGMTPDEVLAAYPGQAARATTPEARLGGLGLVTMRDRVSQHDYRVDFVFDDFERLLMVVLEPEAQRQLGDPAAKKRWQAGLAQGAFEDVAQHLTRTLGPPSTDSEEKKGSAFTRKKGWAVPEAQVLITYRTIDATPNLLVEYRP